MCNCNMKGWQAIDDSDFRLNVTGTWSNPASNYVDYGAYLFDQSFATSQASQGPGKVTPLAIFTKPGQYKVTFNYLGSSDLEQATLSFSPSDKAPFATPFIVFTRGGANSAILTRSEITGPRQFCDDQMVTTATTGQEQVRSSLGYSFTFEVSEQVPVVLYTPFVAGTVDEGGETIPIEAASVNLYGIKRTCSC